MTKSRKKNKRKISSATTEGNMFYGLKNQGSTCYLNSVLQVLFMNEEFRGAVKRHTKGNNDKIDRQLSELFDKLSKGTAETIGITNKLGIHSVHKQSDAAEYFEKILKLTSPEASRIFQGQLEHTTKCLKCHKETNENGKFWHLPLALPVAHSSSKDYSVSHAVTDFFKESELSGDNQLYCDHCQGKMDSIVECKMRHHPDVLTLLLKRFEFNYNYMSYTKNNCAVDVPHILHMPQIGPTYELYAVVEHFGSLKSGHYTATIKDDRGARWYNFNDSTVQQINQNNFSLDNRKSYLTESHSPYLLFYRKRKQSASNSTCEKNNQRRDALDERRSRNIPSGHDVKDKTARRKNTTFKESEKRGAGNVWVYVFGFLVFVLLTNCLLGQLGPNDPSVASTRVALRGELVVTKVLTHGPPVHVDKQVKERTEQKAEPSFQNSVKVQKPVEVNVIRESRSDHVIEHREMGELITKPKEKKVIENVRGVKEVDKMEGKVAPKDDDISTTVSSSTKRNDRKKQNNEPDTDSRFGKKFSCGKWKWCNTEKPKAKRQKGRKTGEDRKNTKHTQKQRNKMSLFFLQKQSERLTSTSTSLIQDCTNS